PNKNEQQFIITSSYTLSNSTLADLDTSVSDEFSCPPHHCRNYDCYSLSLPSDSLHFQPTNTINLFQKTIDYIKNFKWASVFGSFRHNQSTEQQSPIRHERLYQSRLAFLTNIEDREEEVDKSQTA